MTSSPTPRLPCQVCGRPLVPVASGLTRTHNYPRGNRCRGSGYRQRRWEVGQLLRHHSSGVWEVVADLGGKYGDYSLRCVEGIERGRDLIAHGEYMHRHGWRPVR